MPRARGSQREIAPGDDYDSVVVVRRSRRMSAPPSPRLAFAVRTLALAVLGTFLPPPAAGEEPAPPAGPAPESPAFTFARFGAGEGPSSAGGVHRLLDAKRTPGQSNAIAFDRADEGAREEVRLLCRMRVLEGGDGGAFLFLDTSAYGVRGPAPFVANWTEPNLRRAFAVGIDVHDPKNEEPFGPWGNVQGLPEREVSLHWDGRELVKRVASFEFRGDFAEVEILLRHVPGGAEVSVRIGDDVVHDGHFVADLHPFEMRLALAAGTRTDATTEFDVKDLRVVAGAPAAPRRPPLRVEVFHHVRTDNSKTAFEAEVDLPPAEWAFARVVLTLELHDAGNAWDEWDRNGEVSVRDAEGVRRGLVPFITSYRTPCLWKVDVTHFRPLLAGRRRLEVAAGTTFYKNRGYLMSVSLDFHHGTPALEPYRVVPLWHGTARYGSAGNHFRDFFEPRTVAVDAAARAARIFTTTTGHSQVGEFTPAERAIVVRADVNDPDDAGRRFTDRLWKTDCYLNPNRPQFGTWKYPRAGWAPGDVVAPWWIDVSHFLRPGKTLEVRYVPQPYDFSGEESPPKEAEVAEATHVVRSYLVLYRDPSALRAAPTLRILDVTGDGAAAKAGVRAGDYLSAYDGRQIDSVDELRAAIQAAQAAGKERIALVVFRGTERLEVEVAPGRLGVSLGSP